MAEGLVREPAVEVEEVVVEEDVAEEDAEVVEVVAEEDVVGGSWR